MRLISILPFILCCSNHAPSDSEMKAPETVNDSMSKVSDSMLIDRFAVPEGYNRTKADTGSFAFYLRHLPLKPAGSSVKLYNGENKPNNNVYAAVVDMEISPRDLQQCADAVMRLRGEYLYAQKQYTKISFRFLGDGKMHSYLDYTCNDRTYAKFRKYMDHVFNYANTASLKAQLRSVAFEDMQIGDVLIESGNPYGHAVIVVDICVNAEGEKRYMLAQSYMPAQETQILLNPESSDTWYGKPEYGRIRTPEWTFESGMLMRW